MTRGVTSVDLPLCEVISFPQLNDGNSSFGVRGGVGGATGKDTRLFFLGLCDGGGPAKSDIDQGGDISVSARGSWNVGRGVISSRSFDVECKGCATGRVGRGGEFEEEEEDGDEGFDEKLFERERAISGGDGGQAEKEEVDVVVRGEREKGTRGGELRVEVGNESSSILSSSPPSSTSSPRELRRMVG